MPSTTQSWPQRERALLLEPWGAAAEQSGRSGRNLAQVFIWGSTGARQEAATFWLCVTAVCPRQCLFAVACLKCLWDGSLFWAFLLPSRSVRRGTQRIPLAAPGCSRISELKAIIFINIKDLLLFNPNLPLYPKQPQRQETIH